MEGNMYKLVPFVSEKIWGDERWIVSTHAAGQSVLDGMKLGSFLGEFPLLIKIIRAEEVLSVQVHPDDEYARLHENSFGKTECWYVLDAKPGAFLFCGLNRAYTKQELADIISCGQVEKCLRKINVAKGDFVFIPAGTVHAIGGGLRLLEVQEPSDITYRLYDWGRGRELHLEKTLDVIKPEMTEPVSGFKGTFSCDFFELEKIDIDGTVRLALPERNHIQSTGWQVLFVLSGSGRIESDGCPAEGNKPVSAAAVLDVTAEDTLLVRTCESLTLTGNMSLMRISR